MMTNSLGRSLFVPVLATATLFAQARSQSYQVDPQKSTVTIAVGKSGAFSFAGHTHEVKGPIDSGTVELDRADPAHSRVRIVIPAASLKVSAQNEPPADVPKVQERMESDDVLAVARHPNLTFESTSVSSTGGQLPTMNLKVDGNLTIRNVTRPISVPVRVELDGDAITVTGRFTVKQTTFGITPVNVGGVVTVKDALDIRFSIVARRNAKG
jgi:polyisoprenoid-binding protein YceI